MGNPHARIFEVQSQNNNPVISYDAHQVCKLQHGVRCCVIEIVIATTADDDHTDAQPGRAT